MYNIEFMHCLNFEETNAQKKNQKIPIWLVGCTKKVFNLDNFFMHHSLLKCHGHVKTLDDFFVVSSRIICMMRGHIKLVFCFAKN